MDVIDLCSGDGWFTLQIAKVARNVSAIDIDPNFLEVARHRLSENGATNCDFIVGDAYDIAKLAAPADFVFMVCDVFCSNGRQLALESHFIRFLSRKERVMRNTR